MTQPLSASPVARTRRRSIWAAFALVAALVATGAALPASAVEVGTGPGVISGTVTLDGVPTEGISVSVYSTQGAMWSASATTDAAGHYEFTGLPVSTYSVSSYASGHQQAPAQSVAVTDSSPPAIVNFTFVPFQAGVGTISGIVTGDGIPLSGQSVAAWAFATGQNVFTETDESGFYQFGGLASGDWSISLYNPAYQYPNTPTVVLTDSAPTATVNVALISWPVGTGAIIGVLTDIETSEPLANVSVSLYGHDVAHSSSAYTDETGAFSFDLLPEGNYGISYSANGYLGASDHVLVVSDQTLTVNHALIPTNATISGHLQDVNGTPVAGIYVSASTANGYGGAAQSDANGDYLISDLGAVEYTLHFGGPGTPYDYQERVVTAVANTDVTANFTLVKRTTGYLTGWVFGPDGDYFQQPVCATLYSAKSKKPLGHTATYGPDFGDGTYIFDNLKPGRYTVEFRDCDDDPSTKFDKVFLGGVKTFKDATFVTIAAGQDSYENNVTMIPRSN